MFPITAGSADELYTLAREELLRRSSDKLVSSRAGDTAEILGAMLELTNPRQRWMSVRYQPLNPAFALIEVIWILRGRNDSGLPNHWNPDLPKYSGEGPTYYGAYGERLARRYGFSQLDAAFHALSANPESRQVVLSIWNPGSDLPGSDGEPRAKDIPCNITSMLKVRNGKLHWTQIMRSNDVYRGLPHNIVQWTSVQEILAGWLGCDVGHYRHYSDSLHLYSTTIEAVSHSLLPSGPSNTADLRLPRSESESVLAELERISDSLAMGLVSAEEAMSLASKQLLPEAYQDWLVVLIADHLRRTGHAIEGLQVLDYCHSDLLRHLSIAWFRRKGVT